MKDVDPVHKGLIRLARLFEGHIAPTPNPSEGTTVRF